MVDVPVIENGVGHYGQEWVKSLASELLSEEKL